MEIEGQKIRGIEIILIKNEQVDLFASLVSFESGKAMVHGRVFLGGEKKLHFSSDTKFKGSLRSEFLSACQTIADYYGADLFRRMLPLPGSANPKSNQGALPFYELN